MPRAVRVPEPSLSLADVREVLTTGAALLRFAMWALLAYGVYRAHVERYQQRRPAPASDPA